MKIVCNKFPKDIWRHIRSFSSNTAYETTLTENIMYDLHFRDDSCVQYMLDYGPDSSASIIITVQNCHF